MLLQVQPIDISVVIGEYVDKIAKFILPYALTASAVGALSMAILQTIKDIFPIRAWFQRYKLKRWFEDRKLSMNVLMRSLNKEAFLEFLKKRGASEDVISIYFNSINYITEQANGLEFKVFEKQLMSLATDRDSSAFYNLPIEQMCGQINASAQIAIEYPVRYFDVLLPLVAVADINDALLILATPSLLSSPLNEVGSTIQNIYTDSRNRVAHQIQRAIDAIQISFGNSWKQYLQIASIALSGIICAIGVENIPVKIDFWSKLGIATLSAIIGGFLAPVARDLVAALQKLRG